MKKITVRRWLISGVLTVILLAIAWVIYSYALSQTSPAYEFHGIPYNSIEPAPEFTLTDQHNQLVQLSDFRGKVVLMYFGFTNCPDFCPITLGIWNQVSEQLGNHVDSVQFLFITVDPERDTPEQLASYLSQFTADVTGLTGTVGEMEDVMTDYSVFFEKIEFVVDDHDHSDHEHDHEHEELMQYDYWVNHTSLTFLINQEGQLMQAFAYATAADDIVADLEYLLR